MGRTIEEIRAELTVAELEAELVAAKEQAAAVVAAERQSILGHMANTSDPAEIEALAGKLSALGEGEVDPELKLRLRAARQAHRELRSALDEDDSASPRPDAIETSTGVQL